MLPCADDDGDNCSNENFGPLDHNKSLDEEKQSEIDNNTLTNDLALVYDSNLSILNDSILNATICLL